MNSTTPNFNPARLSPEYMESMGTEPKQNGEKQFLLPGQMFVSEKATTVTTILGSCVAVCLWDAKLGVGGMNHYVLPDAPDAQVNTRYGTVANEALLKKLLALGCQTKTLQAKVFGGSQTLTNGNYELSLGARNVRLAVDFLREKGI